MDLGAALKGFSIAGVVGGLIFSSIGMFVFMHGKRTMNPQRMLIGGALMLYCMFTNETLWIYLAGTGLTFFAYINRNAE
jgi:hypothetical protein